MTKIETKYENKFVVLSLPRSRSAWCKHFLSYGGEQVGHDVATRCGSVAEFKEALEPLAGTCETGAVLGWRLIREELPGVRLVVIRRDPVEVFQSLLRFGIEADLDDLVRKWVLLDVVAALPGVLTIQYPALGDPQVCKALFEFTLDLPFDWQWWEDYNRTNIQVDMGSRLQELIQNRPRIEAFKAEVAARTGLLERAGQCLN